MRRYLVLRAMTLAATLAGLACGSGTSQEPWDGSGPAEDVPFLFHGRCNGHVCSLSEADVVFEGLTGGWPSLLAGAIIGDSDGDRYDDIALGDPLSDTNGTDNGILYLFYGRESFDRRINVGRSDASVVANGWNLRLGSAVAPAGILRGNAGVLFGAPGWQGSDFPAQGRAFVFAENYFRATGRRSFDMFGIHGLLDSDSVGSAGRSLDGAGDLDGDGYRDVVVGAPLWRTRDGAGRSAAYVVHALDLIMNGLPTGEPSTLDSAARIHGADPDADLGRFVAGVGDVDGDGFDDVLLGGRTSYLLYGGRDPLTGDRSTDDLESDAELAAVLPWGPEVSAAGDVDGDGLDDFLLVQRIGGDVLVHIVYGRTERLGHVADGADLGPTVRLARTTVVSLAALGDVDGDGLDDFAIGDPESDRAATDAGSVFLFLGRSDRRTGEILATDADVILEGPADEDPCTAHAGSFVSGRGDVNWDGRNDILIGASGSADCGKIYLVLGANR